MQVREFNLVKSKKENEVVALVKEATYYCEQFDTRTPEAISKFLNSTLNLGMRAEEYVYMICLDKKFHILGIFQLSHGTVDSSKLSTREVCIRALLCGCVYAILVHNHPSNDCNPSPEDHNATYDVKQALKSVGIRVADHIIVGEDTYFSFKENGVLP